jgi:hypothetical protein
MLPYETYRIYQIQRAKSPAEVLRTDEQAARLASAVSALFRGLTRPRRAMRGLHVAGTRGPAAVRLSELFASARTRW